MDELAEPRLVAVDLALQLLEHAIGTLEIELLIIDDLGEALFVGLEILHAVKAGAQLVVDRGGFLLRGGNFRPQVLQFLVGIREGGLGGAGLLLGGFELEAFLVHILLRLHHPLLAELVSLFELLDLLLQFGELLVLRVRGDVEARDELRGLITLLREGGKRGLDAGQLGGERGNLLPQSLLLGAGVFEAGIGFVAGFLGSLLGGESLLKTGLGIDGLRFGGFERLGKVGELGGLGFEVGFESRKVEAQLVLLLAEGGDVLFLGGAGLFGVLQVCRGGGEAFVDVFEFLESRFAGGDAFLDAFEACLGRVGLG